MDGAPFLHFKVVFKNVSFYFLHTKSCFHLLHRDRHWPVLTIISALFLFALPLYSRSVKQWVICQLVPLKTLPSLLSGMQLTGRHPHTDSNTHTHAHTTQESSLGL